MRWRGRASAAVAGELAQAAVAEVITVEHAALAHYTPDAFVQALRQVSSRPSPALVLLPHTYQTRDFSPTLATRLDRALVTDVIGVKRSGGDADVRAADVPGQAHRRRRSRRGRRRTSSRFRSARSAPMPRRRDRRPRRSRPPRVTIDESKLRQKPEAPFQEAKQAVDLSQAERIVSVGRGIKSQENIAVAEKLAKAFGAELAASRPICDNGWLPMERQIGSSGQTVAPKLYVALGISGAIQHLVGMKGARTIVAINKDAEAPIFEVADYGIQGDLFEIAPALIAELQK